MSDLYWKYQRQFNKIREVAHSLLPMKTARDSDRTHALIDKAKPLFLIAPPRSGTTVLTHILNAHPSILLTNETAVFMQLNEAISKSNLGAKAGINYGKNYHALWAQTLRGSAKDLIEGYYSQIAEIEEKSDLAYWGEKHPHLNICLDFLDELYPQATYIYLVRDPRDVVLSISKMRKDSFENQLTNWKRFSTKYEPFISKLPSNRLIHVKYENLVDNYHETVSSILSVLGLPMTSSVSQYIDANQGVQAHGIKRRAKKFDSENASSRWKTLISSEQNELALKEMGGFIQKYGYDQ